MRLVLSIIFVWVVGTSTAQTLFENDVRFYDNKAKVTLTHYSEYQITEKFGIADYVFVTDNWGELTVGPYYKPTKNSLITVLPGIETDGNFRVGFYGYYMFDTYTISAFYEKGNVDYWDFQMRRDWNNITVMLRNRQDYGIGIPIGYRFDIVQVMYTTYINKGYVIPTFSLNLIL